MHLTCCGLRYRYDPRQSLYDQFAGLNPGLSLPNDVRFRPVGAENRSYREVSEGGKQIDDRFFRSGMGRHIERRISTPSPTTPSIKHNQTPSTEPLDAALSKFACHADRGSGSLTSRSPGDGASPPSQTETTCKSDYAVAMPTDMAVRNDTGRQGKAFTCPVDFCRRPFRRLEHLKRHVRTHTRERPFMCQHCGRPFSRHDNLLQHMRTHTRVGENRQSKSKSESVCPLQISIRSASEWPASVSRSSQR